MDKFEETMHAMMKMPADQQAAKMDELKKMCNCPGCPTYTHCAKEANEILFCANGKSFMCIDIEKECICPKCPVSAQLGLKYNHFCTRGAEKAQRFEHTIWGAKMV
jgi:hypothetical protein